MVVAANHHVVGWVALAAANHPGVVGLEVVAANHHAVVGLEVVAANHHDVADLEVVAANHHAVVGLEVVAANHHDVAGLEVVAANRHVVAAGAYKSCQSSVYHFWASSQGLASRPMSDLKQLFQSVPKAQKMRETYLNTDSSHFLSKEWKTCRNSLYLVVSCLVKTRQSLHEHAA